MQSVSASLLELQLNQLADKGALFIRSEAVAAKRKSALNKAFLSFWFTTYLGAFYLLIEKAPSLFLISALISSAIIIPIVTYFAVLIKTYLKTETSREQALKLYENELNFNDDLQIVDEFRRKTAPTEFENAALASCSYSVHIATEYTLPPSLRLSNSLSPRQICIGLLGILFFITAMVFIVFREHVISGQAADNHSLNTVSLSYAMKGSQNTSQSTAGEEHNPPQNVVSVKSQKAQSSQLTDKKASSSNFSTSTHSSSSQSTSAAMSSASSITKKTTAEHNNQKMHSLNQSPQLKTLNEQSKNGTIQASEQTDSAQLDQMSNNKQTENKEANEQSSSENSESTQHNEQQKSTMQSPAPAQNAQQAQRNSKKSQSNKNKGQQQSSGSQQNSNSENSSTQGDDEQKKSRGINQLMLSVPMEDQFIGTPGPGIEKRMTDKTPSEEKPYKPSSSEPRGQPAQSATVHQKPLMQSWQKTLMRDFFKQQHQTSKQNEKNNDH